MDLLKLYRGHDYVIKDNFYVKQSTVGEIVDFGEQRYFSVAGNICSTPNDLAYRLEQLGIDFTKVSDYEVFIYTIAPILSKENTSIFFGNDIDFSSMIIKKSEKTGDRILYQHVVKSVENKDGSFTDEFDIEFDEFAYNDLVTYLRLLHGFEKNDFIPGNEGARLYIIEESKEKLEVSENKEYKSTLLNLVSTMVNMEGFKYNAETVFNMKLFPFMDSVKRIKKIKQAFMLMQSAYSGFGISMKDIDKEDINYLGDI